MRPGSRRLRRATALATGDPRSAVTTAVNGLSYHLTVNDAFMSNALVAADITCYNLYRSNDALNSSASSETTVFTDSDSLPDSSVYDFSPVNEALKSCEKKMNISKAETKKLLPTPSDPKLSHMIFLERTFISPILNSSSPLTPDQIRILTSMLS